MSSLFIQCPNNEIYEIKSNKLIESLAFRLSNVSNWRQIDIDQCKYRDQRMQVNETNFTMATKRENNREELNINTNNIFTYVKAHLY